MKLLDEKMLEKSTEYKSCSFVITGQTPSGKNAVVVTRSGHRYPQARFVNWRKEALKQLPKLKMIEAPCSVMIDYFPSDNRRRDVPGIIDALWHLLERGGLIKDDCLLGGFNHFLYFYQHIPKKGNAKVKVTLIYA